ncbi:MAG: hypothetical protein QOF22_825 [Bradyrhizobium sp.]|jgi:hypothetical protein|nr:hypothetical protein [Bradyrhizobium sp.]
MTGFHTYRVARPTGAAAIALLVAGLVGKPAQAVEFDIDGWTGSVDTALVSSGAIRTSAQATGLFPPAFGGKNTIFVPTFGDLNFKQGDLISQPNRVTEELQLKKDETTIFVRGTAFYDSVLSTGSNTDFRTLDHGSINASGRAAHLLDAFIDQKFDFLGNASSIRVGNQVINWGESTFIQGGINSAAPVDLTALHAPGTELKDVILPVTAIDFKTSFAKNLSFEGYYQVLNVHDRLDGAGTFFGSNTAGPGGYWAVEGSATHNPSQAFLNFTSLNAGPFGAAAPFGYEDQVDPTKSARNLSNEFGAAFRATVPEWSDAEFGAYFENYASRTPFPQLRTGTEASVRADQLGLIGFGPSTSYFATSGISFTYPENIHLLGASFNFNGPYELAFQGEVSSRLNQPIVLALTDTFIGVDVPALCDPNGVLFAVALKPLCNSALADPVIQALGIKPGEFNTLFQTYKRFTVNQAQFGITKLWSDIPNTPIQTVTLVAEAGGDWISNFPSKAALLNDLSTNSFSGFPQALPLGQGTTQGTIQSTQLPSSTAYGYVVTGLFDFPHTLPAGIDMVPRITFQHDVQGTSPTGAGLFVAHTAQIGIGIDFSYLTNLTWGLSYVTNFNIGGSPEQNPNIDLDFVSAYIGYQF